MPETPTPTAPTSPVRPLSRGARFTFHGLDGTGGEGRVMKVLGVSVGGRLQFTMPDVAPRDGAQIFDAPIGDVLAMLQLGIWRPVEGT